MALIDDIRKRLEQQEAAVSARGGQQQAQGIMQAATGKAGTSGPASVKASTEGESMVDAELRGMQASSQLSRQADAEQIGNAQQALTQQGEMQRAQLGQQREMAQSEMASQAIMQRAQISGEAERTKKQLTQQEGMRIESMTAQFQNNIQNLVSESRTTLDNVFSQFKQDNAELEFRRDSAVMENIAFQMAMADKAYTQEVVATGRLRQLENDVQFKKEIANIMYGEGVSSTLEKLRFQGALNQNERQFAQELASMDINQAIAILNAQIQQANTKAVITAGTSAVSSVGSDYAKEKAAADAEAKRQQALQPTP